MIRAWQASRRACSAVTRSPVEVVATPIPVSRVSRSRVTITLVVVPPWTGSPVSGRFSRNATNASPRRRAIGSASTSPRGVRRGEV